MYRCKEVVWYTSCCLLVHQLLFVGACAAAVLEAVLRFGWHRCCMDPVGTCVLCAD
jgi:hypothetical protein